MLNKDEIEKRNVELSGTAIILANHFKGRLFDAEEVGSALGVSKKEGIETLNMLALYCLIGKSVTKDKEKFFVVLNADQRMQMIQSFKSTIESTIKHHQDALQELEHLKSAIFKQKLRIL